MSRKARAFICGPSGEGAQCLPVNYFDSFELAELARKKKRLPPTHMHIDSGGNHKRAWGPKAKCALVAP